jgi:hypothetical protein
VVLFDKYSNSPQMLKPRIPELPSGRVPIDDRRKIRNVTVQNHPAYWRFVNECPNIWHKKPDHTLNAIRTKSFSRV